MTNDLISRSKVEEVISALVHEEGVTDDAAVLGCMVWNAVHTMEAVDAAPVVHGRWIEKQEATSWCDDDVFVFYECSVCHDQDGIYSDKFSYCPNCGVKMDKEEA